MKLKEFTGKYRSRLIMPGFEGWIKKGDNVLDVGCGDGTVGKEIKKHFGCNMTYADIVPKNLENFRLMTPNIPAKNKEFDVAILNVVLHHCKDWLSLIKETQRVASTILVCEHPPAFYTKWSCFLGNLLYYRTFTIATFYPLEFWKKHFEIESRIIDVPFWYPFKHYIFRIK